MDASLSHDPFAPDEALSDELKRLFGLIEERLTALESAAPAKGGVPKAIETRLSAVEAVHPTLEERLAALEQGATTPENLADAAAPDAEAK